MPTTLVAVGAAALLAAAFLDDSAFSARALAVICTAAAVPDLDAFLWFIDGGLHNAALHNIWIPLATALLLRSTRGRAWLRTKAGPNAVVIAWVAIAAYSLAVAFDLFNIESAAVLWPVHDRFFAIVGKAGYSTTRGIEFTLIRPTLSGGAVLPDSSYGTVAGEYHVPSALDPVRGSGGSAPRRIVWVNAGWELLIALAGGVVAGGRLRSMPTDDPDPSAQLAGDD